MGEQEAPPPPPLRERGARRATTRAPRLSATLSEMADPEALAAALEKEKAALVAEKAKSKSNLSKVVLLSKEKKALEDAWAAIKAAVLVAPGGFPAGRLWERLQEYAPELALPVQLSMHLWFVIPERDALRKEASGGAWGDSSR